MKRLNLEATDKNILNSIKNDILQRSTDVGDFLMMLDTIDYNAFISVDAAWGEGKTFFVRQAEMTMKYCYKKVFEKEILEQELQSFQSNRILGNLELKHTYLPIYFNAWLYDNHINALMALLMVAIKQSGKFIDTIMSNDKLEVITAVLDSIQFWKSSNWGDLSEKLKGKNILGEALLLEDVRQKVKEIFADIFEGDAEKLVIFIDELDRCRPTFAIEILESIKHYFDDDRIVFVMSINKSQLIHTVSKYYGDEFDSNLYLNKFFDINIQLPQVNTIAYFNTLEISCDDSYWIKKIANELQRYFSLSLRDTTRYFQKIISIHQEHQSKIGTDSWKVMILFIPVLCVLDIVNVGQKSRLLSGNGFDILEKMISQNEEMRKYIFRLFGKSVDSEEDYNISMEELKKIYEFGFKNNNGCNWYEGHLDIHSGFKNTCLRICNSV